jgi:hypothetical protein
MEQTINPVQARMQAIAERHSELERGTSYRTVRQISEVTGWSENMIRWLITTKRLPATQGRDRGRLFYIIDEWIATDYFLAHPPNAGRSAPRKKAANGGEEGATE